MTYFGSEACHLFRQLRSGQSEAESLEGKLMAAHQLEISMTQDLRAAESALANQDQLEAQIAALREQIEENKGEQGKLSNYKQVCQTTEG